MAKYLDDTGLAHLIAKFATVAISGSYNDLLDKPTIPAGSVVDTVLSSTSTNPVQNKVINTALAGKANTSDLANYLPLIGGNMTGGIIITDGSGPTFRHDHTNGTSLRFGVGSGGNNRGIYQGSGNSHYDGWLLCWTSTGQFSLRTEKTDGTLGKLLVGNPEGNLVWGETNVSLNGHTHTESDITDLGSYLPLSGGTLTGNICGNKSDDMFTIYNQDTDQCLRLWGATSWNTGANLYLFGKDDTSQPGEFMLRAHNGTNNRVLDGKPDGTLSWGGTDILRDVNTEYLRINGGNAASTGAHIVLYGGNNNTASNIGQFYIVAKNSSATKTFIGKPDGTLTWDGTAISLNGHTHSYLPLSGGSLTGSIDITDSDSQIILKNTNAKATRGTAPSANLTHVYLLYRDKNGKNFSGLYHRYYTTKKNELGIIAYNGTTTDTNFAGIFVGFDANGNSYSTAVTPAATSNSTDIATTAWVKAQSYLTSHQSLSACVKNNANNSVTTGNWIHKDAADGFLRISGGSAASSGGNIILYGENHETFPGCISLSNAITGLIRQTARTSYLNLCGGDGTAAAAGGKLTLYGSGTSLNAGYFIAQAGDTSTYKQLIGTPSGSLKWNGQTVQTSSDERLKTAFSTVPDEVLDAWGKVNWEQFKYKESVAEKGEENSRWHPGLVAQRVKDVFETNGLDACTYGILCYDKWDNEYDENGTLVRNAGDLWTLRYEEALAMEAIYQRRRANRLEEKINNIEKWISDFIKRYENGKNEA